jgi:hypothetical protein
MSTNNYIILQAAQARLSDRLGHKLHEALKQSEKGMHLK